MVGNYLELYKLRNQAEVYKQNIEQTKRLLTDITAKAHEGLALNNITRYELQLKSLELALTQIENNQIILIPLSSPLAAEPPDSRIFRKFSRQMRKLGR